MSDVKPESEEVTTVAGLASRWGCRQADVIKALWSLGFPGISAATVLSAENIRLVGDILRGQGFVIPVTATSVVRATKCSSCGTRATFAVSGHIHCVCGYSEPIPPPPVVEHAGEVVWYGDSGGPWTYANAYALRRSGEYLEVLTDAKTWAPFLDSPAWKRLATSPPVVEAKKCATLRCEGRGVERIFPGERRPMCDECFLRYDRRTRKLTDTRDVAPELPSALPTLRPWAGLVEVGQWPYGSRTR